MINNEKTDFPQQPISAPSVCEPDRTSRGSDSDGDLPSPIPLHLMHHHVNGSHDKDDRLTSNVAPNVGPAVDPADESCSGQSHFPIAIQADTVTDIRGFEETHSPAPLDPNLKCPTCAKHFKKGRIQKYKRHVEICGR